MVNQISDAMSQHISPCNICMLSVRFLWCSLLSTDFIRQLCSWSENYDVWNQSNHLAVLYFCTLRVFASSHDGSHDMVQEQWIWNNVIHWERIIVPNLLSLHPIIAAITGQCKASIQVTVGHVHWFLCRLLILTQYKVWLWVQKKEWSLLVEQLRSW